MTLLLASQITKDTPTATIQQAKAEWTELARGQEYPDRIWGILKWLGKPAGIYGWKGMFVFEHDGIAIVGGERTKTYVPGSGFLFVRNFSVWTRNPGPPAPYERPIDAIVFNSKSVMSWGWELFYIDKNESKKTERAKGNFFLYDAWVNRLLSFHEQSIAEQERIDFENIAASRQALLDEVCAQ